MAAGYSLTSPRQLDFIREILFQRHWDFFSKCIIPGHNPLPYMKSKSWFQTRAFILKSYANFLPRPGFLAVRARSRTPVLCYTRADVALVPRRDGQVVMWPRSAAERSARRQRDALLLAGRSHYGGRML